MYICTVSAPTVCTYVLFQLLQYVRMYCFSSDSMYVCTVSAPTVCTYVLFQLLQYARMYCFSSYSMYVCTVSAPTVCTYVLFQLLQYVRMYCFSSYRMYVTFISYFRCHHCWRQCSGCGSTDNSGGSAIAVCSYQKGEEWEGHTTEDHAHHTPLLQDANGRTPQQYSREPLQQTAA